MKNRFLEIFACPICYSQLFMNKEETGLICNMDNIFFSIKQGIPILLKEQSQKLLEKL